MIIKSLLISLLIFALVKILIPIIAWNIYFRCGIKSYKINKILRYFIFKF